MERPGSPDSETLIIGGRRVQDAKEWPATFKFGQDEDEFCTATAVGPRVILTAAHCLPDGAKGHVVVNDTRSKIVCNHHPQYTSCPKTPAEFSDPSSCPAGKTTSADYALCLADMPLAIKEYESVNTNAALPESASVITLTGYGCNQDGGFDGGFGYLFEGETQVETLPAGAEPLQWSSYYIITKGNAALCYGDSGGPSYKLLDVSGKSRLLIGVNSRSNMKEDDLSYLSATNLSAFTTWARDWAKERTKDGVIVQICGLHTGVSGCHP